MSDTPDKITIRIAIDIPANVAAETIQSIEPMLARLTSGSPHFAKQSEPKVASEPAEDLSLIARQELERKRKAFFAQAPRVYSMYRRVRPNCDTALQAYKIIADAIPLDAPVAAEVLVQRQRRNLKKYIQKRRQSTALQLVRRGWTNKAIGERLGVSTRSVTRLLNEMFSSISGGSND